MHKRSTFTRHCTIAVGHQEKKRKEKPSQNITTEHSAFHWIVDSRRYRRPEETIRTLSYDVVARTRAVKRFQRGRKREIEKTRGGKIIFFPSRSAVRFLFSGTATFRISIFFCLQLNEKNHLSVLIITRNTREKA